MAAQPWSRGVDGGSDGVGDRDEVDEVTDAVGVDDGFATSGSGNGGGARTAGSEFADGAGNGGGARIAGRRALPSDRGGVGH